MNKRTYAIPSGKSKWQFMFLGICCVAQYPNIIRHWQKFTNEPSFKTGWFLVTIVLLIILAVILAYKTSQTVYIISVGDNEMSFQKKLGNKCWSEEIVTTVIKTSNSYRLYSDDKEVSFSKNLIADDLSQHLETYCS